MVIFIATIFALGIMSIAFWVAAKKGNGVATTCSINPRDKGKEEYCGTCSSIVRDSCNEIPSKT